MPHDPELDTASGDLLGEGSRNPTIVAAEHAVAAAAAQLAEFGDSRDFASLWDAVAHRGCDPGALFAEVHAWAFVERLELAPAALDLSDEATYTEWEECVARLLLAGALVGMNFGRSMRPMGKAGADASA